MQDRVPLYPGRVTLTPVSGQNNTYDMARADSPTQEGTALSKANLLKDTTAALYGLDENAVPDEVLAWLGKYNEHWWSLLHGQAYSYYEEVRTDITQTMHVLSEGSSDDVFKISKSISIDAGGNISLNSPTTLSGNIEYMAQAIKNDAPCYFYTNKSSISGGTASTAIYYIPSGATYYYVSSTRVPLDNPAYTIVNDGYGRGWLSVGAAQSIRAKLVTTTLIQVSSGGTTYEHSTDRNAYPDSGTVDSIVYSYLGVPFEKFPTMPQIATGSYTGTGKYGSGNKNTLTFGFQPKLVFVEINSNTGYQMTAIRGTDYANSYVGNGAYYANVSWGQNTVTWYSAIDAGRQLNASSFTYYYLAIG